MNRRSLLGAMLAACTAPAYVKAGILMPVRQIIAPTGGFLLPAGMMEAEFGEFWNLRFIESPSLAKADMRHIVRDLGGLIVKPVGDHYRALLR